MDVLNIGCGAGFSGDRLDAPGPVVQTLIARGGPAALIFETLAERTLAFAQIARRHDPAKGYEALLQPLLRPVLADCLAHGVTVVGNFGAANPPGAARAIAALAAELGLPAPRIAVIEGDDLSARADAQDMLREWLGERFDEKRFVSASVYQGAFEIAQAIRDGAQIVVAGRVADPSLTLGPAIAHFGWSPDDWDMLAGATMAGHLLECGAQVTGGYYADPGRKDVPGMDNVGFPIAQIAADGSCIVGKAEGTGGVVNAMTVKEQLLYEVHDPSAYLTPDVVADLSEASVQELGPDRVRLSGVKGHPRPPTLKAAAFFEGGWAGDAEISYAGPNAEGRARLSMDILRKRLGQQLQLRFDLIGVCSILGDDAGRLLARTPAGQATDVRLRAAARHADPAQIDRLHREVTALWTGGPAGGGGVKTSKRQRLDMANFLLPREQAPAAYRFIDPESHS
ncbi:acyclic terpene utilization AtuA family protein [Orrella sp. JC864]|uniref:acyclic terpene utilization AtuA family protein n=1 Tax=Orrella sp. JC864 TaxID=3120298 RepID=UPI00300B593D